MVVHSNRRILLIQVKVIACVWKNEKDQIWLKVSLFLDVRERMFRYSMECHSINLNDDYFEKQRKLHKSR